MLKLIRLENGLHRFRVDGEITIAIRSHGACIHWEDDTKCSPQEVMLERSARFFCTCDPDLMENLPARIARQVVLELPENSLDRARRLREGLSTSVVVDPCIVDAIQALWGQGIETLGSCCGHNKMRAWVAVHKKDYERMFELGYEQRPVEVPKPGVVHGLYTFYL